MKDKHGEKYSPTLGLVLKYFPTFLTYNEFEKFITTFLTYNKCHFKRMTQLNGTFSAREFLVYFLFYIGRRTVSPARQ